LSIDLATQKIYLAGEQKIFTWVLDDNSPQDPHEIWSPNEPIHAISYDGVTGILYWIQGQGKLYKKDVNKSGSPTPMGEQLPPGIAGIWSLAVDAKSQILYWTNGKEIWSGTIQKSQNELFSKAIHIPNAESPYPLDLDFDTQNSRLYWVDQVLEKVCSADALGHVQQHFEAKQVRKGIAIDDELGIVYWISHCKYLDKREMVVIEEPGCFFFAQHTQGQHFFQTTPSIPLSSLDNVHWQDSSPAEEGSNFPLPLMPDGGQPQVMNFEAKNKDFINLGPMLISYKEGFSLEAWVKVRSFEKGFGRLIFFGNESDHSIIELWFSTDGNFCGHVNPLDEFSFGKGGHTSRGLGRGLDHGRIPLNTWVHVAFTIDKTGLGKLYLNGKESESKHFGLPPEVLCTNNWVACGPLGGYLDAEIASVRISNVYTDAETIQAHFNHPPSSIENIIQNDRFESFSLIEGPISCEAM